MIDLKQFCSTDRYRPYLHQPFSRGEFTYSTNGHVCVRVPRMVEYPEQEKPDLAKLFAAYFKPGARGTVEAGLPERKEVFVDCEDCDGRGTEHDCPECHCTCDRCDGDGRLEKSELVTVGIGTATYDAKYIRKLMTLPGFRMDPNPPKAEAGSFTFDGGEGIVMPLRWEDKPHISAKVII